MQAKPDRPASCGLHGRPESTPEFHSSEFHGPEFHSPDFDGDRVGLVGSIDAANFRDTLGRFATGVTVATTVVDGVQHAMTANAFTSVSLDPPLVLVCAEKLTRFHDAVAAAGVWAVSVLGRDAEETSQWFARRGRRLEGQLDRFRHEPGPATGCALLCDAIAWLECRTWATYDGGDHAIVVGEVVSLAAPKVTGRHQSQPLIYFDGQYRGTDARLRDASNARRDAV